MWDFSETAPLQSQSPSTTATMPVGHFYPPLISACADDSALQCIHLYKCLHPLQHDCVCKLPFLLLKDGVETCTGFFVNAALA